MPKELIYGEPWGPPTHDADGRPITFSPQPQQVPVVEIRWSREAGDVQVCTREHKHEVPGPDEQSPIPSEYGYYATLDRRAINDLIRHLRRARDAAFGKDE